MLVRLRLRIPDRPGSLGLIASTLGAVGVDIVRLEMLESEAGRAVDDVYATVHDSDQLERAKARLNAMPGVLIIGEQFPVARVTAHSDLELIGRVMRRPESALQTLIDGLPLAVGGDWAVLLEYADDRPVGIPATSVTAPSLPPDAVAFPRRLSALVLPDTGGRLPVDAALAPLDGTPLAVLVARTGGPAFHRTEVWCLGQIADIVGTLLRSAAPV